MRKFSEIDDSEIIEAIRNAKNQTDVLRILDVNNSGGSRRSLRNFISKNNIDVSNFESKLTKLEYETNPKVCKYCGNPIPWSNHIGDFCSNSCANSYNNSQRKKKKYCINCGKELSSSQNKYCSINCQNDYENKQYIERWKQGLETGLKGEYGISNHIRRYLFETRGCKCEICGWSKTNPYTNTIPIEIHHIDGNYLNNKEENLQILCPNCHSLTETYKSHNKEGRKGREKYIK